MKRQQLIKHSEKNNNSKVISYPRENKSSRNITLDKKFQKLYERRHAEETIKLL